MFSPTRLDQRQIFRPIPPAAAEQVWGGGRRRASTAVGGARGARVSGAFYQINMAMNFIFAGNNNVITTIQGNNVDAISFKGIGWLSGAEG